MSTATFKSAQVSLNVSAGTPTVIGGYVVPASTSAIVTAGAITNKSASNALVDVRVWNGSSDIAYILYQVTVPPGASVSFAGADSKWSLGTGQGIRFNANQICDAVMGIMELA